MRVRVRARVRVATSRSVRPGAPRSDSDAPSKGSEGLVRS